MLPSRRVLSIIATSVLAFAVSSCASTGAVLTSLADGLAPTQGSATAAVTGFPTSPELLMFGGRGHRVFLGCLNCSSFDSSSVFNQYGTYGNAYSATSVFNRYGDYGSRYGSHSACNPYASDPPVIVDRKGNYYGRLTVNRYAGSIRHAAIAAWLAGVCGGL
jgi:hypothetical protein